MAIKAIS
jgi:hypothetical protein